MSASHAHAPARRATRAREDENQRYFDQEMQAWVTVCPPGVAQGATRADVMMPRNWRPTPSAARSHERKRLK